MTITTRQQFLLTATAYLLLTAGTAQAEYGPDGNGNSGPGNWDSDDDGAGNDWSCRWFSADCDDDDDDNGNNGNSNSGSSSANLSGEQVSHYNRIITIHAVLACLVWVFLIPLGGILVRLGFKSPWIVRIHAILQSLSYIIYIAAAALGVYLVRSLGGGYYSFWSDPHTKLGVAILGLAFFQPILGVIHHSLYKRRAAAAKAGTRSKRVGRTVPGYVHLWLGRTLIVLGMVNGGLGLRLSGSGRYAEHRVVKGIAYGVGAGIMFVLYVAIVVLGERRRSKERREAERDAQVSGVPLVVRDGDGHRGGMMSAAYTHPPTYEDSQESLRKDATTARYT